MAQASHNERTEGALAHEALANPLHAHVVDRAHQEPGTMDITRQEATFVGFMRLTMRLVIVILVILVLLALLNG